jgi:tetratricopeptide (TPR) repeat protein
MFRFFIVAAVLSLGSAVVVCGQAANGQNSGGRSSNGQAANGQAANGQAGKGQNAADPTPADQNSATPGSNNQNSSDQNSGYQIPTTQPSDPPHSRVEDDSKEQSGNSSADSEDRLPSASSGESSSKSTQIDLSPPDGDDKDHPDSASAVHEGEEEAAPSSQVEEFHSWDPHKAAKDVEVGDYYFKLGNYRAALSRYQEALEYKQNDAVANFRTAQCQEKLNNPQDAAEHYEAYLKILPNGPLSNDARKSLAKLQKNAATPGKSQ